MKRLKISLSLFRVKIDKDYIFELIDEMTFFATFWLSIAWIIW